MSKQTVWSKLTQGLVTKGVFQCDCGEAYATVFSSRVAGGTPVPRQKPLGFLRTTYNMCSVCGGNLLEQFSERMDRDAEQSGLSIVTMPAGPEIIWAEDWYSLDEIGRAWEDRPDARANDE